MFLFSPARHVPNIRQYPQRATCISQTGRSVKQPEATLKHKHFILCRGTVGRTVKTFFFKSVSFTFFKHNIVCEIAMQIVTVTNDRSQLALR